MADESTSFWGVLDKVVEGAKSIGGAVLDSLNTKNMSEAQIAQARANEAVANASATQSANLAAVAPFFGTDTTKIIMAAGAAFVAWKLIK